MTPAEAPYQRVVREITQAIRDGDLKPGDPLPGAVGLAGRHRVSKATAQRAINHLKDAGLVQSVVGVGITVTDTPPAVLVDTTALVAMVREHEDRISALEAALLDVQATTRRPRPTGGTSRDDRRDRGHGRVDRPGSAAGA